ncbi:MAG: hypothetical protein ACRC57_03650 [Sarcina sp.]
MKVSLNRIMALICIMIINIAYSIYLGSGVDEIVAMSIFLIIMPLITLGCLFVSKGLHRKIIFIVLFVITVILILIGLVILFFTGTFGTTGFSIKAISLVTLVLSPMIASYVYLAYIQFIEINSKYTKRRNFF